MPKIIAISGEIGWDVYPDQIREQINQAKDNEPLEFQISSPGGYIYDGLEIFNLIKGYPGQTTTTAIGMAASMASYLLMAGDVKKATSNSIFMIHNARAFTGGDQNAHRKLANILEGMSKMLAQEYVSQTGKTKEEITDLMDEETYLFGNEIIEAGFVDEIIQVESEETAKDDVVIDAMLKVEAMTEKLRAKPEDYQKIAAKLSNDEGAKLSTQRKTGANSSNLKPKDNMDLDQFLAENPAAKVVYDKRLSEAKTEGIQEMRNDISKVAPILNSQSYDAAIRETAIDALNGDIEISAFMAMVKVEDRRAEAKKSEAAREEQKEDTPPEKQDKSKGGVIKTAEDEAAAIAELKGV